MAPYTRPDSPVWWLYLETTKQKERTEVRVGKTTAQRHDSRKLAEDRYHQRMNEVAARLYKLPTAMPAIRFTKYADAYDTTIALHRGARREREMLKPLLAYFGAELLSAIDADRVRAYMQQRRSKVAAVTVNREVDLLKAMLRDACPKYLSASPIAGLKRLPTITPKRRLLLPSEEAKLLAVGDAQDRAILILGIDTLLRLGDLLDLEWIDYAGKWLYVRDPKGAESYEVALSPRAIAAIDALPVGRYLFPKFRRAENPRDWPGSVRKRLRYLCAAADVPYGKKKGGITFHWATRRTGATRLLMGRKPVPVPVVQRHGNWKNPDVLLSIYAEAGRDDLLKAVGSFPVRSRSKRKRA